MAKSGIVSDDMEYDDSDAEIWNPVTSRKNNRTRRCSEMSDSDREKQNESKKARRKEEGEVWKVIVEFEEISSSKLMDVEFNSLDERIQSNLQLDEGAHDKEIQATSV
ncbi:unnamed protein product [Arctogadus glacialis]